MKKFNHAFSIQFFVLFLILFVPVASAQTFVVTETDDPAPDGCNSGTDCSLREAIIAANDVGSGTATIQLVGGQTYTLSIVNPTPEDDFDTPDETTGSLKILNSDATVRIEATGSGMATIDANGIDRVFIIYSGTDVEFDEIEITGGDPESGNGGGIFVLNNDNLEITNSSITGNTAISSGGFGAAGGIWAEGVSMTITGSTISNNTAGFQGGGLRIIRYNEEVTVNSDVTIENSVISNNDGGQYGGGVFAERAGLTITESTISDNQVTFVGGGINISIDGNVTIDRSTIDGNTGGLSGGLDIGGGEALIINSTISGNEAENFSGAGGIYAGNFSDAVIDIVNTTITNNTAGNIGGIINGSGGAVINFSNSIVANQESGDDCSGTITSHGNNISSDDTCSFTETGDQQNIDPLLGPLQDNGGPVFTHALSTDPLSPAINNGNNTLYSDEGGDPANDTDANGNDRVFEFGSGGIIDIGAFEVQQSAGIVGCPVTHEDKILFVKKDESGSGANWFDALGELRDALALFEDETCTAEDVEEIWVSAGIYLPTDDSGDREATFLIPEINILGGFEGDETREFDRDLESNISILSGEINGDNNLSGNSYHVVSSIDNSLGLLSDFTITGGNANGSDPHDKGGGFYANNGGLALVNIIFENNYAETAGGGGYVEEDGTRPHFNQPGFSNSIFINNSTGNSGNGGGLALIKTETRITAATFENNEAGNFGGGLYNEGADPVLKNVIFKENYADSEGGGILNTNSSPELFNVLIINNDAKVNGGGLVNALNSNSVLTNVTISGNESEFNNGGGIYNRNSSAPILFNTIVWGNTASSTGNEIWNSSDSSIEIDYSLYSSGDGDIVKGDGFADTNSLTSNPLFDEAGDPDGSDNIFGTSDDGFALQSSSPAINTGDPDTEMSDFNMLVGFDEIDLAKNPRVFAGDVDIIDMGAYEFQGNVAPPSNCPATDGILFVKKGESGTGSGWDDALGELRDVYDLFDSEDCTTDDVDEVWVAAGEYLPTDNTSDRTASFSIVDDVDFYGGFEGINSETSTEDRDWDTNVTILSGDIDDSGGINENSYHVVTAIDNASETILDGFTVTGGNADLVDANDNSVGGGLYVNNGILTIRNSVFNNNFAEISGGGVFIKDSGDQPIFTNVEFSNNSSNLGGGLASENSSPRISQSTFLVNFAEWGGGARLLGGNPLIEQSVFTGNTGNTSGGGLSMRAGTVAKSVQTANDEPEQNGLITNSVFSRNEVLDENGGGAGIIIEESNVTLRNILVSGNSSDGYGGGIQFMDAPASLIINSTITGNRSQNFGGGVQIINSSPTVQNSIVWNNDSIDQNFARADNFSKGAGDPVISYSLIEGCNPGGTWDVNCGTDEGNNLSDTDPLFDTGITPGDAPTTDGDFSLTSVSPVINIGSNTLYTDSGGDLNNDDDLADEDRLYDGNTDVIDLGAYEFQGEPDSEEPEFAPFITTWEVEAEDLEITIPTAAAATYNYDVDWGDGESDTGQAGDASHTYDSADTYTVKITGTFPQIEFGNTGDKDKIMSVEQWGDIEWASMRKAFQGAINLEINAEDEPDLSNATSMLEMFSGATSVNGGLENWDVSNITSMFGLFDGATSFNGDISGWTVSAATDMIRMFAGATAFNQDIGDWEVDNVSTMESMFDGASSFNQDLSEWNTGNVDGMLRMFTDAAAFNQNLGSWDIEDVTSMSSMLDGSGLSTENYDATLTGWAAQTVQSEVELGADGLTYCEAEADRQSLITDDSWNIQGDDLAESCGESTQFITTWKTDNDGDSDDKSIRIPMIGNGYDFNVDWGDGNDEDYNTNPGGGNTHFLEHTYASAGEYEVKITGDFPRIYFNFSGDRQKILTIKQWGDIEWASMEDAFHGASNLTYTATDTPDLSGVSNMREMFKNAELFNGDIGDWDVKSVTDMSSMFREADAFNMDIGDWDVSGVTSMAFMFFGADLFNQDIGSWNVSDVNEMRFMFGSTGAFNQDISTKTVNAGTSDEYRAWDVSNVLIMRSMFEDADAFNQNITNWDVSSVTDMVGMFKNADIFNQDISTKTVNAGTSDEYEAWNMSSVQFMSTMFFGAQAFNQNLGTWNIESAESMTGMLDNSGLSTENYDNTLIGWESQSVQNGVALGADGLTYCEGESARQSLMDDDNWEITGDDLAESCVDEPVVLDAPTLSSPDDESNDVNRPVTLVWNAVDDATSYDVQVVLESGSFNSPFFDEESADNDIEVPGLDPSAEYKWQVRAVNNETQSEWSEVWTFTTSADEEELMAPQLSSPSDGATEISLTVTLDWDAAGGAESYKVQLVEDSGSFESPNFDSEPSDTEIGLGLSPLTKYKWRVRSLAGEDESEWSEVWTFTTMGLPESEDQRILVSNADGHIFSKTDFGISNDDYFIKIETLPDEGTLELDGSAVNPDDEISIEDINDDELSWDLPEGEYGYNFTSFEFRIVDDSENQSDNPYTLTIDLGTVFAELSGSEGWRFISNPSDGDSYFDLFSGITVEIGPPPSQTLYELDQENYEWDPVGSTGDEPGVGTPFIVYLLGDDLPVTIESGDNWNDLDGSYSFSGLDYDPAEDGLNPDDFYLLGNPHPIALDFCEFTDENMATSVYYWNPEANDGNGDYVNLNCAALEDVLIAPFQAFWVRTTDINPVLEIPMEAYLESTTDGYFKEKSEKEEQFLITLNVTGNDRLFTNRTQILFADDADKELDKYDAPKLSAEGLASQWLSFHSMDENGRTYAFQSLPASHLINDKVRIPLDIQTTESGRFTLDWALPEANIFNGSYFLRDNDTGEVMELREGSNYSFEITPDQSMKVPGDERSAKSLGDFADLGMAVGQPSDRSKRSDGSEATPRFELLIASTGVDGLTELGAVPDDFTLAQNYPNPFNPTTVINYQLPVSSEVRLEVYDMLGRNVATLVNSQVSAGRHTVNFDASNLSSGVYLYRLVAGNQIMTKKLTILK